jgi:hypothetical protein
MKEVQSHGEVKTCARLTSQIRRWAKRSPIIARDLSCFKGALESLKTAFMILRFEIFMELCETLRYIECQHISYLMWKRCFCRLSCCVQKVNHLAKYSLIARLNNPPPTPRPRPSGSIPAASFSLNKQHKFPALEL